MTLPQSDDQILLIHNPRCSKSRAALALLQESGRPFQERRYLDEPLALGELEDLQRRLGKSPAEWLRAREAAAAEAGISAASDDAAILAAMAAHPILIERPIVVRGSRAVVGRPPEDVGQLLG